MILSHVWQQLWPVELQLEMKIFKCHSTDYCCATHLKLLRRATDRESEKVTCWQAVSSSVQLAACSMQGRVASQQLKTKISP
jgi:hypothetical protein